MKKLVCATLALMLLVCSACSIAEEIIAEENELPNEVTVTITGDDEEEEEEQEQEETPSEKKQASAPALKWDGSGMPDVRWKFGVSLTALESGYTLLVNADNLLDKSYKPQPLVKVKNVKRATSAAVEMQEAAAGALKEMFDAAAQVREYSYVTQDGKEKVAKYDEATGMRLFLKSGYRSYGTQATTYANYLARNNNVDDGVVAKPGASEHQTGLCADILNADYASRPTMTQDFKWTPEAQWLKENCADFGFILRYPEDKTATTGIIFEPWHFRYVGKEAAWYITSHGITLEEFDVKVMSALAEFVGAGGSVEEQIAYEFYRLNAPPESFVLEEMGEDGDAEVSLAL